MMSLSSVLYSPGESRDPADPPLSVFRPSEPYDSDPDYTNIEVSPYFSSNYGAS